MYKIFTDGSCDKKLGSWAAVINDREISGFVPFTTCNRMEIFAVIKALGQIPANSETTVFSDSTYVVKGISLWIYTWIKRGWPNRIKNKDLWLELLAQKERVGTVTFKWIPREQNTKADYLAGSVRKRS